MSRIDEIEDLEAIGAFGLRHLPDVITFVVDARPVPQGSLTPTIVNGRPGVRYLKADELFEWRAAVARACPVEIPEPGPYRVSIAFRLTKGKSVRREHPTTYPDLDKLVRGVLDALTGRVWDDDAQVVELHATKRYADGPPGCEIVISAVSPVPAGIWG